MTFILIIESLEFIDIFNRVDAIYLSQLIPNFGTMKLILEIEDNKKALAHEVFKSMSFVKNIKVYPGRNEITNKAILKSIEDYEKKELNPPR